MFYLFSLHRYPVLILFNIFYHIWLILFPQNINRLVLEAQEQDAFPASSGFAFSDVSYIPERFHQSSRSVIFVCLILKILNMLRKKVWVIGTSLYLYVSPPISFSFLHFEFFYSHFLELKSGTSDHAMVQVTEITFPPPVCCMMYAQTASLNDHFWHVAFKLSQYNRIIQATSVKERIEMPPPNLTFPSPIVIVTHSSRIGNIDKWFIQQEWWTIGQLFPYCLEKTTNHQSWKPHYKRQKRFSMIYKGKFNLILHQFNIKCHFSLPVELNHTGNYNVTPDNICTVTEVNTFIYTIMSLDLDSE